MHPSLRRMGSWRKSTWNNLLSCKRVQKIAGGCSADVFAFLTVCILSRQPHEHNMQNAERCGNRRKSFSPFGTFWAKHKKTGAKPPAIRRIAKPLRWCGRARPLRGIFRQSVKQGAKPPAIRRIAKPPGGVGGLASPPTLDRKPASPFGALNGAKPLCGGFRAISQEIASLHA